VDRGVVGERREGEPELEVGLRIATRSGQARRRSSFRARCARSRRAPARCDAAPRPPRRTSTIRRAGAQRQVQPERAGGATVQISRAAAAADRAGTRTMRAAWRRRACRSPRRGSNCAPRAPSARRGCARAP
jgi:hypothetical protein